VERRAPKLATSKWWKEERHGVFLDYNQNAKDRTVASAYSVRARADARVSAPIDWTELDDCDPADFTLVTMRRVLRSWRSPPASTTPHARSEAPQAVGQTEREGMGDAP
jgi:DNA primase